MAVIVCLLRGVNMAGHNKIKMDELRRVCGTVKLRDAQTYVQSGNIVFRTDERDLERLTKKIQSAIERKFGISPRLVLRTAAELRDVVARNPFAKKRGVEPNKLAVIFLASEPTAEARAAALKIQAEPEEWHLHAREAFIYFPNGMARPKLSWPTIERRLKTTGTGRNWNTVTKLLEMAEKLEAGE